MKALATGATGFIGSHLVEALASRGDQVSVLVRPDSRTSGLDRIPAIQIKGDYDDPDALARAVAGMDVVFHVGGLINALDDRTYEKANVVPTRNLIRACAESAPGLKRFVFVSSISATGPSPRGTALNEDAPRRPISGYGRSKVQAEDIVRSFEDRLPVAIIRPPNVLGPRQKELFTSISLIAKRVKPIVGRNEPQTSIAAVEDICRAMILLAEHPAAVGRVYFVTDGRAYSFREITAAVAAELGVRRFFLPIPYPLQYTAAALSELAARIGRKAPALTRDAVAASRKYYWIYDDTSIRNELGFMPEFDMKEAVKRTVAWYAERGLARVRS
jgi:nucleoside-diphosphate-sugar epimerase